MPNRYICDVIQEIRTAIEVGRIDMIRGLTEEIQTMANRMEAKLADYAMIGYDLENAGDFKYKLKKLQDQAKELERKLDVESPGLDD
jgi:hypothetical protein